jgi:hypothetical protein
MASGTCRAIASVASGPPPLIDVHVARRNRHTGTLRWPPDLLMRLALGGADGLARLSVSEIPVDFERKIPSDDLF